MPLLFYVTLNFIHIDIVSILSFPMIKLEQKLKTTKPDIPRKSYYVLKSDQYLARDEHVLLRFSNGQKFLLGIADKREFFAVALTACTLLVTGSRDSFHR